MKWEQRQDKKEISQRHFVYEPNVINPHNFGYLVYDPHLSDENILILHLTLPALVLDKHNNVLNVDLNKYKGP